MVFTKCFILGDWILEIFNFIIVENGKMVYVIRLVVKEEIKFIERKSVLEIIMRLFRKYSFIK